MLAQKPLLVSLRGLQIKFLDEQRGVSIEVNQSHDSPKQRFSSNMVSTGRNIPLASRSKALKRKEAPGKGLWKQ